MKFILPLISMLVSLAVQSQKADTLFIQRTISQGEYPYYHVIYFDTTAASEKRKSLIDFTLKDDDTQWYFEALERMKPFNNKVSLNTDFPKKWISLYRYKNVYYTYRPSEAGEHFRFQITDSTTIEKTMEGVEPHKTNKISYLSQNHIKIERTNGYHTSSVEIKIIDAAKGIAVFTHRRTEDGRTFQWQRLMVNVSEFYSFPSIINYCRENKMRELDFDEINFEALLK
jgi:hypothetical protein